MDRHTDGQTYHLLANWNAVHAIIVLALILADVISCQCYTPGSLVKGRFLYVK